MTTPALRADANRALWDAYCAFEITDGELVRRAQALLGGVIAANPQHVEERIALMMIAAPICDEARIAELTKALREEWQA